MPPETTDQLLLDLSDELRGVISRVMKAKTFDDRAELMDDIGALIERIEGHRRHREYGTSPDGPRQLELPVQAQQRRGLARLWKK